MDQSHFNTIEETRKSGRHLSLEECGMIQALHRKGYSLRSIAAEVNCAHTTVFYELRRGTPEKRGFRGRMPQYTAKRGHNAYLKHRKNSRKPWMTVSHLFNGWPDRFVKSAGRWMPV